MWSNRRKKPFLVLVLHTDPWFKRLGWVNVTFLIYFPTSLIFSVAFRGLCPPLRERWPRQHANDWKQQHPSCELCIISDPWCNCLRWAFVQIHGHATISDLWCGWVVSASKWKVLLSQTHLCQSAVRLVLKRLLHAKTLPSKQNTASEQQIISLPQWKSVWHAAGREVKENKLQTSWEIWGGVCACVYHWSVLKHTLLS